MRYGIVAFMALVLHHALLPMAQAQSSGPLVRTVARHVAMLDFEISTYKFQCPSGYMPVNYSFTPKFPYDVYEEDDRSLIDKTGATVNRGSITDEVQIDGGGISLTLNNIEHHAKTWEAFIICFSPNTSTDGTVTFVKANTAIPKQSIGVVTAFCPADSPVALTGFSSSDGTILQDVSLGPVWGTSANPILLSSLPDGQTGPPTGWQAKILNNFTGSSVGASSIVVCGKAPGLQAFVYSTPVPQGTFGVPNPLSVFASVPDGWTAVGMGYDLGQYGQYLAIDTWNQDGIIVDALLWYDNTQGYDSGTVDIRAYMVHGNGNAPANVSSHAVVAVLAMPKAGPAPTNVNIVEFYNASLDHYFITANPQEISDLDTGIHVGWARTGQSFKAYGIGSTGRTGRRPVCRAYGQPSAGLDSHFYSASPDECIATMLNFGGAWGLEASEVFEMDLPDAVTGACPSGGVPIYRIFNQRADVNHRYTTSTAIRDQMVAKGGVAEGYGPNAVALCGLP